MHRFVEKEILSVVVRRCAPLDTRTKASRTFGRATLTVVNATFQRLSSMRFPTTLFAQNPGTLRSTSYTVVPCWISEKWHGRGALPADTSACSLVKETDQTPRSMILLCRPTTRRRPVKDIKQEEKEEEEKDKVQSFSGLDT